MNIQKNTHDSTDAKENVALEKNLNLLPIRAYFSGVPHKEIGSSCENLSPVTFDI